MNDCGDAFGGTILLSECPENKKKRREQHSCSKELSVIYPTAEEMVLHCLRGNLYEESSIKTRCWIYSFLARSIFKFVWELREHLVLHCRPY